MYETIDLLLSVEFYLLVTAMTVLLSLHYLPLRLFTFIIPPLFISNPLGLVKSLLCSVLISHVSNILYIWRHVFQLKNDYIHL